MVQTIDLLHLDEETNQLLVRLLAVSNEQQCIWEAGTTYWIGSQEIKLSHRIVKHLNSTSEKNIFEVLDNQSFANGCFGSLYLSRVTLVPDKLFTTLDVKIKPEDKQRLVKIQEFKFYSKERAAKEVETLRKLGFFHCKPLSADDTQSFITMRKLPGVTLQSLITANQLTITERYIITKALVLALKEQVHDYGLVHRDVKPENILIDDKFVARFVDFAFAMLQGYDDRYDRYRGAVPYAGPEGYSPYECCSVKTDIYALGRTLMLLWGDDPLKNPDFFASDVVYTAKHVSFNTLFERMDTIPACHAEIGTLLRFMLQADQLDRPSTDEILNTLASLEDKLEAIPNLNKRTVINTFDSSSTAQKSNAWEEETDQYAETSGGYDADSQAYNDYFGF